MSRGGGSRSVAGAYPILAGLLGIWLGVWIWTTWPAMQDDALIHLRYADNLYLHHFITYDGIHANYGASSLLYVTLLALLRGLTASPELPRAVSSGVHVLLFAGLALATDKVLPKRERLARLAALALLALLVTPSAVRWLDDGMETGLAVVLATWLAWMVHEMTMSVWDSQPRWGRRSALACAAFLAVLLRTELLLLCVVMSVIVLAGHRRRRPAAGPKHILAEPAVAAASILTGAALAAGVIFTAMHVLLPDTAVAKAHGIAEWFHPVHDTAVTLVGAFSFGAGMLVFWLLTLALVAMRRGITAATLLANCFCPVVVALSGLRGQEIQGVRYLAWTFFCSITWNILELGVARSESRGAADRTDRWGAVLLYGFLGLLVVEMPFESVAMHRVMTHRAATERIFEAEHLEVLRARRGVASDIGFIGYFTGAEICDLAGLVNGRAAARLTSAQRVVACAGTSPEFLYGNKSQLESMAKVMDLAGWRVCGQYGFANVRTEDVHYLMVRPELAGETCRATGHEAVPALVL